MNFVTNVLKKYIQNESQETGKERKVPDVITDPSEKENGVSHDSGDSGKAGSGKLRLSFLKAFDPLYSESLQKSDAKSKLETNPPDVIIEDVDRQSSPIPLDVSDDEAPFVDATYIAASDEQAAAAEIDPCDTDIQPEASCGDSLLQFYTPRKYSPDPQPQSTSKQDLDESLFVECGAQSTSESKTGAYEILKVVDSAEEDESSLVTDVSESYECLGSDKNIGVSQEGLVEPAGYKPKEKIHSYPYYVEKLNVGNNSDSTYSDVSDIKTDSPPSKSRDPNEIDAGSALSDECNQKETEGPSLPQLIEEVERSNIRRIEDISSRTAGSTDEAIKNKLVEEAHSDTSPERLKDVSHQEVPEQAVLDNTTDCVDTKEIFTATEDKVSDDLDKTRPIEKADVEDPVLTENQTEETIEAPATEDPKEQGAEEIPHENLQQEPGKDQSVPTEESFDKKVKPKAFYVAQKRPEDSYPEKERTVKTSKSKTVESTSEEATLVPGPSQPHLESEVEASKPTNESSESEIEGDQHVPINAPIVQIEPISESDSTEEEPHLDSGVESIEESYIKTPKEDELEGAAHLEENKEEANLGEDEILEEHIVPSNEQIISDEEPKTESIQVISEPPTVSIESEEKSEEGTKPVTIDIDSLKTKMADLSEKLSEQQQENSDLKLQLNASQQAKASLELEIRQKEEVIIKTQAEALKNEQVYKQEIKQLREKLKENSKLIEKDGAKELEEQLKEAKAREAKAVAELNQRKKDELNYQKIMEEYENTIATRFADYQKLKEEHETATRHLANIELAFSDVHQKYERTKALLEGFKANEETLSQSLQASEKTCKQHEERYESLKAHAKAQIEKSNKEILMLRDKYEQDMNKLRAIIKRLEIKCSSLEVSLQQKTEECTALAALCDEVTGKKV